MLSKHREVINPSTIHDTIGYSHITIPKGRKLVFISGQVAWDKNMNVVEVDDLAKQTDMVYQNIEHALNEIGATWDHIAKTTIFTTEPHEYEIIGGITAKYFGDTPPPAQTIIGVTGLALPEFLIEIEATVVMEE